MKWVSYYNNQDLEFNYTSGDYNFQSNIGLVPEYGPLKNKKNKK